MSKFPTKETLLEVYEWRMQKSANTYVEICILGEQEKQKTATTFNEVNMSGSGWQQDTQNINRLHRNMHIRWTAGRRTQHPHTPKYIYIYIYIPG